MQRGGVSPGGGRRSGALPGPPGGGRRSGALPGPPGALIVADPAHLDQLARALSRSAARAEGYRLEVQAVRADLLAAGAARGPGWREVEEELAGVLRELSRTAAELGRLAVNTRLHAARLARNEATAAAVLPGLPHPPSPRPASPERTAGRGHGATRGRASGSSGRALATSGGVAGALAAFERGVAEALGAFERGVAEALAALALHAGRPVRAASGAAHRALAGRDPRSWGRLTGEIAAALSTFLGGTGAAVTAHALRAGELSRSGRPMLALLRIAEAASPLPAAPAAGLLRDRLAEVELDGARLEHWAGAVCSPETLLDAGRGLANFGAGLADRTTGVLTAGRWTSRIGPLFEGSDYEHSYRVGEVAAEVELLLDGGAGALRLLRAAPAAGRAVVRVTGAMRGTPRQSGLRAARSLGEVGGGAEVLSTGILPRRPWEFGDLPGTALGATDMFGNITIRRGLTGRVLEQTLRHEMLHAFLSSRHGPLVNRRAELGFWFYQRSHLVRYLEEAIAQAYGTRSLLLGALYPLAAHGYHLSAARVAGEAMGYGLLAGGAAHAAYGWADRR